MYLIIAHVPDMESNFIDSTYFIFYYLYNVLLLTCSVSYLLSLLWIYGMLKLKKELGSSKYNSETYIGVQ